MLKVSNKYFSCFLRLNRVTLVLFSILQNCLSGDVFIPEAARAQEWRWARAILILDSFWWATKLTGCAAFRCAFPRHGRLHTVELCLQRGEDWLQGGEDVREALGEELEARVDEGDVNRQLTSATTLAVVESLRVWSRLGSCRICFRSMVRSECVWVISDKIINYPANRSD